MNSQDYNKLNLQLTGAHYVPKKDVVPTDVQKLFKDVLNAIRQYLKILYIHPPKSYHDDNIEFFKDDFGNEFFNFNDQCSKAYFCTTHYYIKGSFNFTRYLRYRYEILKTYKKVDVTKSQFVNNDYTMSGLYPHYYEDILATYHELGHIVLNHKNKYHDKFYDCLDFTNFMEFVNNNLKDYYPYEDKEFIIPMKAQLKDLYLLYSELYAWMLGIALMKKTLLVKVDDKILDQIFKIKAIQLFKSEIATYLCKMNTFGLGYSSEKVDKNIIESYDSVRLSQKVEKLA